LKGAFDYFYSQPQFCDQFSDINKIHDIRSIASLRLEFQHKIHHGSRAGVDQKKVKAGGIKPSASLPSCGSSSSELTADLCFPVDLAGPLLLKGWDGRGLEKRSTGGGQSDGQQPMEPPCRS
jgi:hypothetical protein